MEGRSSSIGPENRNSKFEKKKKLENKVNYEKDNKNNKNGKSSRNVKNNTRNINVNDEKTQQCITRSTKRNAVKKVEVPNGEGSGEETHMNKTSGNLNRLQLTNNSKNNSANALTDCEKISKSTSRTERGGTKKEMEKPCENKSEMTPTNHKRTCRSRQRIQTGRNISTKNVNVSSRRNNKKNIIFENGSHNPSNVIKDRDLKNEENKNLKTVDKTCLQKNQNNFKNKRRIHMNQTHLRENQEDLKTEKNIDSPMKNNARKDLNKTHIQRKNIKKTIRQDELAVIKKILNESKDGNNKNINNNNKYKKGESMKNGNEKGSDHGNNKGATTQLYEHYREQLLKNNIYNNSNGIDDSHLFNVGGYISDKRPEFDSDIEIVEIEILGKKIKRKKKSDKETEVENWILKNYFGQDSYGNKNQEMDPFFFGTI